MQFQKVRSLSGTLTMPGDKSISHRAIMFAALAEGTSEVTHFLRGADCLSTIACFQSLGVAIEDTGSQIIIHGKGLDGLSAPASLLDAGNSGTTTRLLCGILAAQPFSATLTGDASIQKRPMKRIIDPLSQMGACITSLSGTGCAPLLIDGRTLHGIHYQSPVASAQVKSAILLAGLYAEGATSVSEPYVSRNHSELMLQGFGASVTTQDTTVTIQPRPRLIGQKITIPGDISSAAYFIAAGLLVPHAEILIRNVGINPTRDGILKVAKSMGGKIELLHPRMVSGEPVADLLVTSSNLSATVIEGAMIPTLIDELPVIAVMAAAAQGTTIIRDAAELKVKESNRIDTVASNLTAMGADVEATTDGMIIHGGRLLHGATIDAKEDHRIAMSFAVASLIAEGTTDILGSDCVRISYPDFYRELASLAR